MNTKENKEFWQELLIKQAGEDDPHLVEILQNEHVWNMIWNNLVTIQYGKVTIAPFTTQEGRQKIESAADDAKVSVPDILQIIALWVQAWLAQRDDKL
jgi:hypothetical protein